MTNNKSGIPKLRFPGYTEPWEQRKLNGFTKYKSGSYSSNQFLNSRPGGRVVKNQICHSTIPSSIPPGDVLMGDVLIANP